MGKKVTFIILAAGLLMIAWGLWEGGFQQVNQIGSVICLECMGLGG